MSGGAQRGAGGDDVVDHENVHGRAGGASAKRRAVQASAPRASGLGRTIFADEQTPTRKTQIAGDQTGDQLRLVESATTTPRSRGGSPGDDVERTAVGPDRARELGGESSGRRLTSAELEIGDQLASRTLVHQCRVEDGCLRRWKRAAVGTQPRERTRPGVAVAVGLDPEHVMAVRTAQGGEHGFTPPQGCGTEPGFVICSRGRGVRVLGR
ncbi:MAG: hypothetical protein RIS33_1642 [Actinomycetota bacterium]